ncbi:two-component sensor histidine kinase [Desulfovibrio sulfodismutans]|uniref:histidine kinase n=2 Tax=Desulfolutivibrio sulfodismutans TaxID=63561 RepID=A0A7K3NKF3_9BACT|nr:two-component sensor histidine kinase [Desulfolutivibrio sulfodismutans]QLA14377.1 two-component sensor histidine kinase [Desulfolutivibrio sulfodismutans DSM 3696]
MSLRRKIVGLMAVVSVVPLLLMAAINYYEYRAALGREIQNPLRILVSKTKNSFELFLAERTSTVSFIASAYPFEELAQEKNLKHIFRVMTQVFDGFVDLGLLDENGVQVSYAGPYSLAGKNYAEQSWFNQVMIRGTYISDVFMGYRNFPHMVIAVRHMDENGKKWVVRATIDTTRFDRLIAAMSLEPDSDAFLLNKEGILQTNSNYYGKVLERLPMAMPPQGYEARLVETQDHNGEDIYLAYSYFPETDFVLMAVKPRGSALKTWYMVKGDLLFIFVLGVMAIFLVVYKMTDLLIQRMRESEERRELAFRQVEHAQKLSSIGRLAAGVAHEINNPLAAINEKAGLMKDLLGLRPDFPDRDKFITLADAILKSIRRCRDITHRMLGFARRMDVSYEELDINEVLTDTLSFLDQEAKHRGVTIVRELDESLPRIMSDRGQLQQVFLNILNNALAAVPDDGNIEVKTGETTPDSLVISFQDNGCGMSQDTLEHVFEPFFTTKKGTGTGLGLSITYGIIKKLGGDIAVTSKQGEGTLFTIYLPKKARKEAAS